MNCTLTTEISDELMGMQIAVNFSKVNHFTSISNRNYYKKFIDL